MIILFPAPLLNLVIDKVSFHLLLVLMGCLVSCCIFFSLCYRLPKKVDDDNAGTTKKTSCVLSEIYNFRLLRKPEFVIMLLSQFLFDIGVHAMFGLSQVWSYLNICGL